MLNVNGNSIAVPVRPPIPGMMPSTSPMMQPSARNIRRWGSMSVRKALPAEAAMKPSSPPITSISSAPRDRFPRARSGRMRGHAARALCIRACTIRSTHPSESVHPAAWRLHVTGAPRPSSLATIGLYRRPLSCFRAHVSRRSDEGKAARFAAWGFARVRLDHGASYRTLPRASSFASIGLLSRELDMSDAASKPWPTELRLHKDGKTLTITFDDGQRFDLSAEYLRVKSPSAEVQGHSPDERKTVAGKQDVAILEVVPIGNYAARLVFDDMHSTGIYSWDYFLALGRNRDAYWQDYLDELAGKGLAR